MRFIAVLTSVILILTLLFPFMPRKSDLEIYENTVRLHIIANSDSEDDQNTKLLVRDMILSEIGRIVAGADNASLAEELIGRNIDGIRESVSGFLSENGKSTAVRAALLREEYPTKQYEGISLPRGEYASLEIRLGDGEGKNWWCVLFPQVCTSAAGSGYELLRTGFSPDQVKLLTDSEAPKYRLRFRLLEIFGVRSD